MDILERLRALRAEQSRLSIASAKVEKEITEAIHEAMASGVSAISIADELGISRARVYQLRDRRA